MTTVIPTVLPKRTYKKSSTASDAKDDGTKTLLDVLKFSKTPNDPNHLKKASRNELVKFFEKDGTTLGFSLYDIESMQIQPVSKVNASDMKPINNDQTLEEMDISHLRDTIKNKDELINPKDGIYTGRYDHLNRVAKEFKALIDNQGRKIVDVLQFFAQHFAFYLHDKYKPFMQDVFDAALDAKSATENAIYYLANLCRYPVFARPKISKDAPKTTTTSTTTKTESPYTAWGRKHENSALCDYFLHRREKKGPNFALYEVSGNTFADRTNSTMKCKLLTLARRYDMISVISDLNALRQVQLTSLLDTKTEVGNGFISGRLDAFEISFDNNHITIIDFKCVSPTRTCGPYFRMFYDVSPAIMLHDPERFITDYVQLQIYMMMTGAPKGRLVYWTALQGFVVVTFYFDKMLCEMILRYIFSVKPATKSKKTNSDEPQTAPSTDLTNKRGATKAIEQNQGDVWRDNIRKHVLISVYNRDSIRFEHITGAEIQRLRLDPKSNFGAEFDAKIPLFDTKQRLPDEQEWVNINKYPENLFKANREIKGKPSVAILRGFPTTYISVQHKDNNLQKYALKFRTAWLRNTKESAKNMNVIRREIRTSSIANAVEKYGKVLANATTWSVDVLKAVVNCARESELKALGINRDMQSILTCMTSVCSDDVCSNRMDWKYSPSPEDAKAFAQLYTPLMKSKSNAMREIFDCLEDIAFICEFVCDVMQDAKQADVMRTHVVEPLFATYFTPFGRSITFEEDQVKPFIMSSLVTGVLNSEVVTQEKKTQATDLYIAWIVLYCTLLNRVASSGAETGLTETQRAILKDRLAQYLKLLHFDIASQVMANKNGFSSHDRRQLLNRTAVIRRTWIPSFDFSMLNMYDVPVNVDENNAPIKPIESIDSWLHSDVKIRFVQFGSNMKKLERDTNTIYCIY